MSKKNPSKNDKASRAKHVRQSKTVNKASTEIASVSDATMNHIDFDELKLRDLAIDIWKLEKNICKAIDIDEQRQIKSALSRLHDYLKSYRIELLDYDGEKYDEHLNIKVLSIEQSDELGESIIAETVRPAVLLDGKIISQAAVIVNEPSGNRLSASKRQDEIPVERE
jgi:molecular chaperone GrpE (heat shock protein)